MTYEVNFTTCDLVGKIQVRQVGPFTYVQRHIWIKDSIGSAPWIDEWIPSLKCIYEDMSRRGKEVEETK